MASSISFIIMLIMHGKILINRRFIALIMARWSGGGLRDCRVASAGVESLSRHGLRALIGPSQSPGTQSLSGLEKITMIPITGSVMMATAKNATGGAPNTKIGPHAR